MKYFNTTGTCFPDRHYMVDISHRLSIIREMIDRGDYFCINRGRQYGKTTTLEAVGRMISQYCTVFQLSFEGLPDSVFSSLRTLSVTFFKMLRDAVDFGEVSNLSSEAISAIDKAIASGSDSVVLSLYVPLICKSNGKPIVLIIDEVDQAGNWDSFVKFLGVLRRLFLARMRRPTFRSVILAGVYDIKNLRLKFRPEEGQQYVIELKIWRGQSYNERGEEQLKEYLDYYNLKTGYMLSFCFNKDKKTGWKDITVGNRTILEFVV